MGDYPPPKRRDVVDRLRRRFEGYRRRQNACYHSFNFGQKAHIEQEKHNAYLLMQKWQESKAKKTTKKSKSDGHSDHRNDVAKRLKTKLDSSSQESQNHAAENVYHFEDHDSPPGKTSTASSNTNIEGQLSSVSVHIVHQINGGISQQDQKISTNVTVSSTLKSQNDKDGQTNVECKQEPTEDQGFKGQGPPNNGQCGEVPSDGILNFEEGGDLSQEVIDELAIFDDIFKKLQESKSNETVPLSPDSEMFGGPATGGSPGPLQGTPGNMNMYVDPSQAVGPVRTPPVPQYRPNQPHTAGSSALSETGPAAETLKQMAAQHQQHHPGQTTLSKSAINPFSDIPDSAQFNSRNGYNTNFQHQQQQQQQYSIPRSASGGPYTGQGNMPQNYPQNKQTMPAGYTGSTKPLTHYPQHAATSQQSETQPSSLQQLQDQVAHFNQVPQMEITQTQHMQVSDGSNRMQMSQTQHVQLRQPVQNISLNQQQSFSVSPGMGQNPSQPQTFVPNEQMAMQQHLMQQPKMHPDQRQAAHMQQYMNRPPPEYKMQSGNGMATNGIGPNPLQTIQNLVNQTNTLPNQAYSNVKSESAAMQMQNGMMQSGQMSALQQQQMSNSVNSVSVAGMQRNGNGSQTQMTYASQAVQRQASYPGAHPHSRAQRPTAPNYQSAIMRNNRPPNVNIGPEGLNISQPRNPHEWPRGMMPAQGVRDGGPGPGMNGPPMSAASMMQYRSYSSDGQSVSAAAAAAQMQMHPQRPMQMSAMQSQAMMQNSAHAQQMMMQQQRMQMSQHMGQRSSHSSQSPPYSMASNSTGATFPQSSASQDDLLNLLDTAPNQSTDFFDVQTSSGTEANWYDIDDILGNPK